jgi:subtilisin
MGDGAQAGAGRYGESPGSTPGSELTGRYLVVLSDDVAGDAAASAEAIASLAGVSYVASTLDYEDGAIDLEQLRAADATLFARLGVAVVGADPSGSSHALQADADPRILAVEPERIQYALEEHAFSLDYVRGFRDGVSSLYDRLAADAAAPAATLTDTDEFTWGLIATRASETSATGAGVGVAILDSGLDLVHPDYAGRNVVSMSFVEGAEVQDGSGHGTHCVGTACGPADPPDGSRRYGVAPEAAIFVGKVLNDRGNGTDSSILAGIDWALSNDVRVISLSLGADVQEVSQAYETVGQRALAAGTLIVAAAGNNANRAAGEPGFVGMPANSPSIMAIAAVDANLRIANFSSRSSSVPGGEVDLAGPGVAVYSSWPMPTRYRSISGTSMSTPHVAGLAALHSQATGARGMELWRALVEGAQPLGIPAADVGAGLAQAPS